MKKYKLSVLDSATKPSQMLRVAIDDMQALDRERYKPESSNWFIKHTIRGGNVLCVACLAGAIIARCFERGELSERVVNLRTLKPSYFDIGSEDKLLALDYFRTGQIDKAYEKIKRDKPDSLPDEIKIENKFFFNWATAGKFLIEMESLHKILQNAGE